MRDPLRRKVTVRFYEELNDFLPAALRKRDIDFGYVVSPSVKDAIESLGVPHTEIDLILANGTSVDFTYRLNEGDRISVYPVFESMDIGSLIHLRSKPLREIKFISDVHLGKLSRYLRICGFNTYYKNHLDDSEIIEISQREKRAILTRDREMLKNSRVTHGYWLRNTDSLSQLGEIYSRFDLYNLTLPFSRCTNCNHSPLNKIDKGLIRPVLLARGLKNESIDIYNEYYQCSNCSRIYWKGTHVYRFVSLLSERLPSVAAGFQF